MLLQHAFEDAYQKAMRHIDGLLYNPAAIAPEMRARTELKKRSQNGDQQKQQSGSSRVVDVSYRYPSKETGLDSVQALPRLQP